MRSVEGAQAAERVAGLVRSLVNGFALLPIAERLVLAECQASAWTDAAIGHGSCNDHASWARCAQQVHLAGVPWAGRRDQPDWLQRLLRTTSRAEPKRPAG